MMTLAAISSSDRAIATEMTMGYSGNILDLVLQAEADKK
jgi:hypothetical protein